MANSIWDQMVLNEREKPLSSDLNLQFSQIDQTLRELLLQLGEHAVAATGTGSLMGGVQCIGESLRVIPNGVSLTAIVTAGVALAFTGTQETDIGGIVSVNDRSGYKPVVLLADSSITIPAAGGSPRVDIIEVKPRQQLTDSSARFKLNPASGIFEPALLNKTLHRVVDDDVSVNGTGSINYKTGTPAANPFPATTDSGYIKIAEVLIPASATLLGFEHISDRRALFTPGGQAHIALAWTQPASTSAPTGVSFTMPPGFRYVIKVTSASAFDIYIIAPSGFTKGMCTAMSGESDYLVTGNSSTSQAASHTATSGDKTAIEGSNTSPSTVKVLADGTNYAGQNVFKFSFSILAIDAGAGTLSYAHTGASPMYANIVLA